MADSSTQQLDSARTIAGGGTTVTPTGVMLDESGPRFPEASASSIPGVVGPDLFNFLSTQLPSGTPAGGNFHVFNSALEAPFSGIVYLDASGQPILNFLPGQGQVPSGFFGDVATVPSFQTVQANPGLEQLVPANSESGTLGFSPAGFSFGAPEPFGTPFADLPSAAPVTAPADQVISQATSNLNFGEGQPTPEQLQQFGFISGQIPGSLSLGSQPVDPNAPDQIVNAIFPDGGGGFGEFLGNFLPALASVALPSLSEGLGLFGDVATAGTADVGAQSAAAANAGDIGGALFGSSAATPLPEGLTAEDFLGFGSNAVGGGAASAAGAATGALGSDPFTGGPLDFSSQELGLPSSQDLLNFPVGAGDASGVTIAPTGAAGTTGSLGGLAGSPSQAANDFSNFDLVSSVDLGPITPAAPPAGPVPDPSFVTAGGNSTFGSATDALGGVDQFGTGTDPIFDAIASDPFTGAPQGDFNPGAVDAALDPNAVQDASGTGFFDKFLQGAESNLIKRFSDPFSLLGTGLTVAGLAAAGSRGNRPPPQLNNLQRLAGTPLAGTPGSSTIGAGVAPKDLISPLVTGSLPTGAQANVDEGVKAAQAAIRSRFAGMGLTGSTMEQQALNSAALQGVRESFDIATQLATTGLNVAKLNLDEQGIQAQIYSDIMNAQLSQDQNFSRSIANFAAALGGGLPSR